MRSFNLYLQILNQNKLIGTSDSNIQLQFSTFEEQLEEAENDQYTLTFSVIAKSHIKEKMEYNPFLSYYFIGAKMQLIIDNSKYIDLIIKDISPTTKENNSIYQITAQDEVSYSWSKHRVGTNYRTENTDGILTPKNIFTIAREVMQQNFIYGWQVTTNSQDQELVTMPISLDITNSNPYNILLEACNTLNAYLEVNYRAHTLDFYRKKLVEHSGYRYHPSRTLQEYTSSASGEEMVTLLHVHGGTDANNMQITMMPPMPNVIRSDLKEDNLNKEALDDVFNELMLSLDNGHTDAITSKLKVYYLVPDKISLQIDGVSYDNIIINSVKFYQSDGYNKCQYYFILNDTQYYIDFKLHPIGEIDEYYGWPKDTGDIYRNHWIEPIIVYKYNTDEHIYEQDIENSNKRAYLYYLQTSLDSVLNKTIKEIQQYHSIYKQHPYLGQYFIDLTPFKPNMTITQLDQYDKLEKTLTDFNIQLQYYSSEYNELYINLMSVRTSVLTEAEMYISHCLQLQNKLIEDSELENTEALENNKQSIKNNIKTSKDTISNLIKTHNNIINKLGASNKLQTNTYNQFFTDLKTQYMNDIKEYSKKITELNASVSYVQAGVISYYKKLIEQKSNYMTPIGENDAILDFIIKECSFATSDELIAYEYELIQTQINNEFWLPFYRDFGQYIYEGTYENSEELDSISLYNQAISYFADLNRHQTEHSCTVLDIGELEQIAIPRLEVGSVISIYNPDSTKIQPYQTILGALSLAEDIALINILQTEIIAMYTNLNNKVGETINIQQIYSDIFNESVFVTGINRVLRNPLQDTVTIEQTSRYKSILAKLIKSI